MNASDYLLALVEIGQRFRIDIPDQVAFNFRSALQIINYINEHKAASFAEPSFAKFK